MNIENIMNNLAEIIPTYGLKVLGAILVLVIGRNMAGLVIPFPQTVIHQATA